MIGSKAFAHICIPTPVNRRLEERKTGGTFRKANYNFEIFLLIIKHEVSF